MKYKCSVNTKTYKECCYKKRIYRPKNLIKNDKEFYNYLLINLSNIVNGPLIPNNEFERIQNLILLILDLELLKEGSEIYLKIQNSSLSNEKQEQSDSIKKEKLKNIEKLRDFQFWHQKILEAMILTQQLQNQLNNLRLARLEYWVKYLEEYNSFVEQIQNEPDLCRLRNDWKNRIDNSQFIVEEKENLHQTRVERIRKLLNKEQESNYQRIYDGILNETNIANLEANRYWSREIQQSTIITETQRTELENLSVQVLVNLSNQYYDEIKKEIPEITDSFLLEDRADIDKCLLLVKYNIREERKIFDLLNDIIEKYIRNYPNGKFTNTQQEEKFFNKEIDKIDDESCLQEKQFLHKLKKKIIEIYNDKEKDQYFINIEKEVDIANKNIEDFIERTIKKISITSDSTEVEQIHNLLQQKELEIKTKEAENIYLKGFLLYSNTVYYYIMSLFEDDENLSISNNSNDLIVENLSLSSNDLVEKDLLEKVEELTEENNDLNQWLEDLLDDYYRLKKAAFRIKKIFYSNILT
ncbi:hypothetical protein C2G38_2154795 [Gigaspora rosea]|uniref:Uncharacterized protein n=1 Tax=Gigaspora rosea TaxID=44941 RepID=A0A397WAP3_9GLOM|nr:hypothetical protein C2G38_2154795 [Gigaspora rosea]